MQNTRDTTEILRRCTRRLTHHAPQTPRQILYEIADATPEGAAADIYGTGAIINDFEAEVATLLGKQSAVFLPSGTMAQQIALRVWADRRSSRRVAMHPRNHLDQSERHGYQWLHDLRPVLVGHHDALLRLDDLEAVHEPLAALLLELPQREIGGQLPSWDELQALCDWAAQRGVPLHMDGARLWETAPFYQRTYAEIAAPFDTVYVSMYKILNGVAGSVLAGPVDVISEARAWQRRHGGNLIHLYPLVISAQIGMRRHLPNIADYCRRAREIGAVLAAIDGIEITPNPPQTNMMHAFLRGSAEQLIEAALDIAQDEGVWLFDRLQPSPLTGWRRLEITIGEAAHDLTDAEIERWFRQIIERGGG